MSALETKQHYQNDAVAAAYDRERFTSLAGRTFDRIEKRAIRRVLRPLLAELDHRPVLDIPCGTGRITELLLEQGLTVTGGDISESMIDRARVKCERFDDRATFRRLDLDGLDLPESAFDLVSCIRLFHHLGTADRARILAEIARVSRRYVLINVSFLSPYYQLRRRLKRALGQGVSRAGSTWAEIRSEAAAAGLAVRETRFVCRYLSEDLIVLLEKESKPSDA